MASMGKALLAAVVVATVFQMAIGASYTVGAPGGSWDLQTNFAQWVSSIKFHPGDQLVFKYSPAAHDVLEVSKADYDSCSTSKPISSSNIGNDVVRLTATGTRYFICGFPSHCTGGMKVQINVVADASNTPSTSAPPPTPTFTPSPAPTAARSPAGAPTNVPSNSAPSSISLNAMLVFVLGALGFGLMAM